MITISVASLARFIQRNDIGLLVGAIRLWFASRFLSAHRLLRWLGLVGGPAFRLRNLGRRCVLYRFGRAVHFISPDRAAVVTLITPLPRNIKSTSSMISLGPHQACVGSWS